MYYTPEQIAQIQRRADEIAASSSFRDPGEPSLRARARREWLSACARQAESELAFPQPTGPTTGLRVSRHYYDVGTASGTCIVQVHPDDAPLGARVPGRGGVGAARVEVGCGDLSQIAAENAKQDRLRAAALY